MGMPSAERHLLCFCVLDFRFEILFSARRCRFVNSFDEKSVLIVDTERESRFDSLIHYNLNTKKIERTNSNTERREGAQIFLGIE